VHSILPKPSNLKYSSQPKNAPMSKTLPSRVLLVSYGPHPPLAESLAAAFGRLGVDTHIFHAWRCNTWFDRLIIHPVNHYAHSLRLVPKSVDLFAGHPKSHKEWRSKQILEVQRRYQPDLVLITGILRFKPEVLQELRQSTTVFFWFTESEKRFAEVVQELPFYHHIFVLSSLGVERARELGFTNVSLLQHGVDTSLFRPLELPQRYDWCFVGQWHPRRQQYVEGLAKVSQRFVIYGPRWRKHNLLRPAILSRHKGRGLWGEELVRLYNQTRVVINISVWADEAQGGWGVNQRLLEAPACSACLLSDYSRDAELLLTPGQHFISARTLPEMQEWLAVLLADDQLRQKIARQGYERASQVRNYDHLVAEILNYYSPNRFF